MNRSKSCLIRYAVAGLSVITLLVLLGWFVLRGTPKPTEKSPAKIASVQARVRAVAPLFSPSEEPAPIPATNEVMATTETNAAVIYRQAFALYDALSQEQKGLLGNWRTNIDAAAEADLCDKLRPICDLLHQAAALTNCDWGVEESESNSLARLNGSRVTARAGIWSAAHCHAGDQTGVVDDLLASARLGQNSSPAVIGHLVDVAIQGLAIDFIANHANTLAGAGDSRLVQFFSDFDYTAALRRSFREEADRGVDENQKLAAMSPEDQANYLAQMTNWFPAAQSLSLDQVIQGRNQLAEIYRQYAEALGLPDVEYQAWLVRFQTGRGTNPFVNEMVSTLERTVDKTEAVAIESAMVVAGLKVSQEGTGALQSHLDPATGQTFTYTRTAEGFELQSSYKFQGKPLTLSFK